MSRPADPAFCPGCAEATPTDPRVAGGEGRDHRRNAAFAHRYSPVRLPVVGALLLPLACGEPAAPVYPPLTITTTFLPNAAPTVAYGASLAATGGDSSYTWSLTDGALPAGLSLASTGAISGTPAGSSSRFTVRVASGDGQTASQQLLIYVYDTLAITTTSLP
ncbi:MAG: putative Ig domain-containing protein, partial [Gemmatimonadota bacterium]